MKRIFFLLFSLLTAFTASAETKSTFLILNSYYEDEAWSNSMMQPIETYLSAFEDVVTESIFLNSSGVKDIDDYNTISDNLFNHFKDNPPKFMAMIGNFAFTMRERIKQEWGDIPILLISRVEEFGPLEDYFTSTTPSFDYELLHPLASERDHYNFTAIITPDYYREMVDMMVDLIPDMDELMFFSDQAYVNKIAATRLRKYLAEAYPSVEFRWVKASESAADTLTTFLTIPAPHTGMLLSSWVYEKSDMYGKPVYTNKDLMRLMGSVNPIFSMRNFYLSLGAMGGVFADSELVFNDIERILEAMMNGKSMHDIPFSIPEKNITRVNYSMMERYGLDAAKCPSGTEFIGKPESYLQRYWPYVLALFIIFLLIIILLGVKNNMQSKTITLLNRHRTFVSNMPIPYTKMILWVDEGGKVINHKYEASNRAYEQLIADNGISSKNLFDNEFRSEKLEELLKLHHSLNFNHYFERTEQHYQFLIYPVNADRKSKKVSSKVLEIDIFALDMTERRRQEAALREAVSRAQESDRMKSAFLANMSHEIRTPLNAIVGFSNLLVNAETDEEKSEYAAVINRNNDLLLCLINDVLDLAKIEANTIDLHPDICDIHDMVESIGKTMEMRIPEGVHFNIIHYGNSCITEVDSSRLAQILINLLTNACKFTQKGSITVGYEIHEPDNMLYFYVKDTGMGIAKEDLDRVFDRFVKLNHFIQGTGLGLAISSSLVEKMGGEIGVDSPGKGKGTTFWFTIPYQPRTLEMLTPTDAEAKEKVVKAVEKDKIAAPVVKDDRMFENDETKYTMLVAEDNPSNFFLLRQLVKGKYNIVEARNGKEAVELFPKCNPDVIVMDINMPVMDGYEAVAEIRKMSGSVPIIAVTAYAFASDRVRILNSGFNAFVPKPISAEKLFDTINQVIRKKK